MQKISTSPLMPSKKKLIYWTPRILSILVVVFIALSSLDVFDPEKTMQEMVLGLFIHNIPTLIAIGVVWVSRKYEIVGAIFFGLLGILYVGSMVRQMYSNGFAGHLLARSIEIGGLFFIISWCYRYGRQIKHNYGIYAIYNDETPQYKI